jgi:phosphoenolpyruvate carboxylase
MKHFQESLERLIDLLDSVVQDQVGASLAHTMQRIRRLAQERRAGLPDAESRLGGELEQLPRPQLRSVIRWLSLFFDLANLVEDLERVQVLQQRDQRARREGKPRGESIAAAIVQLKQQGFTAGELQGWLNRLHIEPVFTAHPSEAKRRTTRQLLRRIRELLPGLEDADATRNERQLLADMTVLWQSDLVRPQRPPVMSEVSRGVFFAATLWHVVPEIYRELRESLAECYPHHRFEVPCFIRFGSWIGGDRDGHPFVTAEITRKTLWRLKRAALENHLSECREMLGRLVMSEQQVAPDEALQEQIRTAAAKWPPLDQRLDAFSDYELCRRFLKLIEYRLEATLHSVSGETAQDPAYIRVEEFRDDVMRLFESIAGRRGELIAEEIVQPWLDQIDTFGFHFAALDVRQNSSVHRQCLDEAFKCLGLAADLDTPDGWTAALAQLDDPSSVDLDRLTPDARECLETFLLLADEIAAWGLRPFGGYVISMTHSPRDVMSVLWLWKAAWSMRHPQQPLPPLPIIPLFETIDDLQRAGDIVEELFQLPDYVDYMSGRQIVMVGYSDSTKDGGYLSACWELHQAQQKLAAIADRHHVELTVFHGRGGALGRGGGPAARAIRSLPAAAVGGRLRVTEQGEVLAERYDDPRIAHRHLEQVVNATLLVSTQADEGPRSEWEAAMEKMSAASLKKYHSLVQHPGFLTYFDRATPIGSIESLPIGSRPARRGQRESLSDLRAIPWTFAWTQSRHLLPAWYGFGTAVRNFVDRHDRDWTQLRSMYEQWPMFRALVDNAELALAKADMGIAHNYARLVQEPAAEEVWQQISAEFDCSRGAVLIITSQHELLAGTQWLSRSIQSRNPYVDPLNLAQVHLLRQAQQREENDELSDLLRLTIHGIASGLRTTG